MKKGCGERTVCFVNSVLALVLLIALLLFKFVFASSADFSGGVVMLFVTGLLVILLSVFNVVYTVVGFVRKDMKMAIFCIIFFILGIIPFINFFAPSTGEVPVVFNILPIAGYAIILVLSLYYWLKG